MQSLMWEEFLGSNVDCYMEASPRLLCTKITRGEGSCNLDEGKSFSVPMWFSTSRLVPDCFAQMLQEKKVCKEEDFSNPSGKKKGCSTNSTTIFDYF